ncbi:MAG: hypothetical protein LAT67_10235 [Balneolales bacterium]|nr:hypothetical protein [Balneolales bacterium]
MRNQIKTILFLTIASLMFWGCDGERGSLVNSRLNDNPVPEPEPVVADPGAANFSKVVTIGDSQTAGFMDGALYNLAQMNSYANLLAGQLSFVGAPNAFNQPDINSANGFNAIASNPGAGVILGRFKLDTSIPGPSPLVQGDLIGPFTGDKSTLNNFSVPGIQLGQLLTPLTGTEGSPAFNPYYARFASNPGSSTILGDVIAANPTFFSMWIGNNDVLGYALSGATNSAILTSPAAYQQQFEAVMNSLMTQTEAKGVVALIPNILVIPNFRAIPYNVLSFSAGEAEQLNAGLATLNAVYAGMAGSNIGPLAQFGPEDEAQRRVVYQEGNNPVFITDPGLMDIGQQLDFLVAAGQLTPEQRQQLEPYRQARPMVQGELLLLAAAQQLGTLADPSNPATVRGVALPLAPNLSLTMENLVEIETARQTFNAIMTNVAEAVNAASPEPRVAVFSFDDPQGSFGRLYGFDGSGTGIQVGTRTLMPDFSPNGVFSTDGIHTNSRGNALIVNDVIRAIENKFGAQIPHISSDRILNLPSVQVCAGDCVSNLPSSREVPDFTFSYYSFN